MSILILLSRRGETLWSTFIGKLSSSSSLNKISENSAIKSSHCLKNGTQTWKIQLLLLHSYFGIISSETILSTMFRLDPLELILPNIEFWLMFTGPTKLRTGRQVPAMENVTLTNGILFTEISCMAQEITQVVSWMSWEGLIELERFSDHRTEAP